MGGEFQPLGQVQILANLIDFGMNLQEAGDAPRVNHVGSSEPTGKQMTDGGIVQLESGFPYETVRQLIRMGIGWATVWVDMAATRPFSSMKRTGLITGPRNPGKTDKLPAISIHGWMSTR